MATNAGPLECVWKVHQNFFAPIMTDPEPAPKELFNFVCCNTYGTNLCSCTKNGLTCVAACGDCRGESCNNPSVETKTTMTTGTCLKQFENFYF